MRRQIGVTVLAIVMACPPMAECGSGSGETTAAATEAVKEESEEGAKDETENEAKNTSAKAEDTGSEGGSGKKYVIGLAINTQTNPFFTNVKGGVRRVADEYGIKLYITGAQNDPTIQMEDVKNLTTERPDAIIINTCDSDAIASSIEACNDAGTPVFIMSREVSGGEVIPHIGYDAIKSGRMTGQYLIDTLGEKGKTVGIQGIMGTDVVQNRSQGFNEVMEDNPNMEIVTCQAADFDRAKGMSAMENIPQTDPKINGLYAASDEMFLDVLEAMKAAGKTDEIVKIGCDATDGTLDAAKIGKVDTTVAEPPFFLGKATLNTAYGYLEDRQVEPHVILDNQFVTQDTVDSLVTKE